MSTRHQNLLVLMVLIVLAGGLLFLTSDRGDEQSLGAERVPNVVEPTGRSAQIEADAREMCGLFPRKQVAGDLGLSAEASPMEIAETYGRGYAPALRAAATAGCLSGLR